MVLQKVRGQSVRAAGKRVGVSHGLISDWRIALEKTKPPVAVADFGEKTRRAVVDFLEGAPVEQAEDYADGIRFALGKVKETVSDLEVLLARAEAARAQETTEAVREGEKAKRPPRTRASSGQGRRSP